MHAADTLAHIAFDLHRERTQLVHRVDDAGSSSTRVRIATALRGIADRLDAGRPADLSLSHPDPLRAR